MMPSFTALILDKMDSDGAEPRATDQAAWRVALALVLTVTLLRLVYQLLLTPWELVGDEAYYWVQGQHLDWCYNEKGALFPWLIRLSCELFGNTQFAVRLPVLLGSSLAAWVLGQLTMNAYRSPRAATAGLIAVGLYFLVPAMQANAQIATQDGLLIPWTLGMSAIGLRLMRRWSSGNSTWAEWCGWWALMGVGMHLRFSAPLLMTAPAAFVFLRRKQLRFDRTLLLQQLVGGLIFLALLSPIVLWNASHKWPTFEHTAGHLGLGGDQTGNRVKGNPLLWFGETVGGIAGAYGPVLVLLLWGSWTLYRKRGALTDAQWADILWMQCVTWPSVGFFVLLSLTKPVIASWPLPSLVPGIALAAICIEHEALFRAAGAPQLRQWFRPLWRTTFAYGTCGALLLMFPTVLRYLPVVGHKIEAKIIDRISGHREAALAVQAVRATNSRTNPPALTATYYDIASQMWFYLPDHPAIHVASRRPSTYDNWLDTRLDAPQIQGRPMLLIGKAGTDWATALHFERILPTTDVTIQYGVNFGGRLAAPSAIARSFFKEGD